MIETVYTYKLSIIVPTFNEQDILAYTLNSLGSSLNNFLGENEWEFVVVDNGSSDSTSALIDVLSMRWIIQKISLPTPDYGNALHHGLMAAHGAYSLIINVDFWDIPFIQWAWMERKNYDLIIASKLADPTLNMQPKYRRFLSWGLNTILHFYFGFCGTDTHGQKLLSMKKLKPILKASRMRRGQYDTEFSIRALRAGLRIAEVPVPITEERPSRNLMLGKIMRNLVDILRLRKVIRHVERKSSAHYHMWSRDDVLLVHNKIKSMSDSFSTIDLENILQEHA
jgi:glycosyltransferase involved in cell wall biosynthesis